MIVSFAWTVDSFLNGSKTVTRRFWTDTYASSKRFRAGTIHQAWDKNPRAGGKQIGSLRITKAPYLEPLKHMTNEHFIREGGTQYWKNKAEFIEAMGGPDAIPWVIEFEKVDDDLPKQLKF